MASMLRAVVVDSDAESRASLRRILGAVPAVAVVGEYAEAAEALREVAARHPDILIVEIPETKDPDGEGWSVQSIEHFARALPDTAILATAPSLSADFIIKVIRAGALEFIPRPVERHDLVAALEKLIRVRRGVAPVRHTGRITSVFSTKGGLGVTTLAINLAVSLAERAPDSAMLVELDTRQSDIATFLDLRSPYSVLDAFENIERLDESFLRGILSKHRSGLWVLPGPLHMERNHLDPDQVRAGLEIVRSHFEHVILDLRHDMDPATIAGLEASNTVLFLTSLNVSALRSGAAGLAGFRHLGLDLQKVKVIVMREDTGEDVTLKHVREALGLPIFWKTPSDYQAVISSINSGRPVVTGAPRSKIARNIAQLAEVLTKPLSPGDMTGSRVGALMRLMWTPKGIPGG